MAHSSEAHSGKAESHSVAVAQASGRVRILTHPAPKAREAGAPWSLAEAGRFLGISAKSLERRVKTGTVSTIRYGRLIRIPDEEVKRLASQGF
jgi:excisionase family DNA binding protein